MPTALGAIADDFTGATDLAGLLARSGIAVSLRIGVPDGPPVDSAACEVIALKIRTAPVTTAVSEARKAALWLKSVGAQRIYWKYCSTFDSTPQGNIGPVARALLAETGMAQAIYCPAFPENGRLVFMGHLFVGGLLLSESPMRDHPLTPMRDSSLPRLLAPQVAGKVGLVDRACIARGPDAIRAELARLAAGGVAHVVADAISDGDLAALAEACHDRALMTGGSALAVPLPRLMGLAGPGNHRHAQPPARQIGPGAVVLSGSCSAMTRQQVAAYIATGQPALQLDPLALARDGVGAAREWLAAQPAGSAPLIYATAEPDAVRLAQSRLGTGRAGEMVEEALAALARLARDRGRHRFVIAGGETSGAVTQALAVTRLDIGAEIAPGVPWCFATSGGDRIALALKSGNFGAESFFSDALTRLEAA